MSTYPNAPGHRGVDTSIEAAAAMAPRLAPLQLRVLSAIRASGSVGLTPDEASKGLRESVLTVRPRVTELSRLGRIVDSGRRRQNASGRNAIVWVAADD